MAALGQGVDRVFSVVTEGLGLPQDSRDGLRTEFHLIA